jgi:hypothetical protein
MAYLFKLASRKIAAQTCWPQFANQGHGFGIFLN